MSIPSQSIFFRLVHYLFVQHNFCITHVLFYFTVNRPTLRSLRLVLTHPCIMTNIFKTHRNDIILRHETPEASLRIISSSTFSATDITLLRLYRFFNTSKQSTDSFDINRQTRSYITIVSLLRRVAVISGRP